MTTMTIVTEATAPDDIESAPATTDGLPKWDDAGRVAPDAGGA
jgi:hypothetical protein